MPLTTLHDAFLLYHKGQSCIKCLSALKQLTIKPKTHYLLQKVEHSMPNKINLDNVKIDRSGTIDFPKSVSVLNEEGTTIFVVDNTWTDEQIMASLKLANHSYDVGKRDGEISKAEQIRGML